LSSFLCLLWKSGHTIHKSKFEPDPNPAAHARPRLATCHGLPRGQRANTPWHCAQTTLLFPSPAAAPELLAQSRVMTRTQGAGRRPTVWGRGAPRVGYPQLVPDVIGH